MFKRGDLAVAGATCLDSLVSESTVQILLWTVDMLLSRPWRVGENTGSSATW